MECARFCECLLCLFVSLSLSLPPSFSLSLSLSLSLWQVSVDGPLPSLAGEKTSGDSVEMPQRACTVGFVEAQYAQPVAACA